TGHLVLSTLHTIDASKTIERIIGVFPKDQEAFVRRRFAATFRYVISPRLVPRIGGGRVAALEILKSTERTRDYVLEGEREGKSLLDAIADGDTEGMQTFDQVLERQGRQGLITYDHALLYSTNETNLRLALADWKDAGRSAASRPVAASAAGDKRGR